MGSVLVGGSVPDAEAVYVGEVGTSELVRSCEAAGFWRARRCPLVAVAGLPASSTATRAGRLQRVTPERVICL